MFLLELTCHLHHLIEQSVIVSGRDGGRGRDHEFGGRDSFEGDCGSYGGRHNIIDKGPRQCKHCRKNNYISEKCYEKFGHPEWGQLADADTFALGDIAHIHAPSANHSDFSGSLTVVLS